MDRRVTFVWCRVDGLDGSDTVGYSELSSIFLGTTVPFHRASWHTEQASSEGEGIAGSYLLISNELIPSFFVGFSPLPEYSVSPTSFKAGAIATTATTTTTETIRASMFTILTSIAVAVAFAHASALPYTQPNLRQRQATNSTIQWQRCTKSFSTSCSQAQVTYVFHSLPFQINMPTYSTTYS